MYCQWNMHGRVVYANALWVLTHYPSQSDAGSRATFREHVVPRQDTAASSTLLHRLPKPLTQPQKTLERQNIRQGLRRCASTRIFMTTSTKDMTLDCTRGAVDRRPFYPCKPKHVPLQMINIYQSLSKLVIPPPPSLG